MVGAVLATTLYRRSLAIRYNFCVSTKGVTLQQQGERTGRCKLT
jgi:hypothetical protein